MKSVFASLAAVSLFSVAWVATAGVRVHPLQEQAEKVFAYDRAHPHALPAGRLRALSLALAFFDEEGARKLVLELGRAGK